MHIIDIDTDKIVNIYYLQDFLKLHRHNNSFQIVFVKSSCILIILYDLFSMQNPKLTNIIREFDIFHD